MVRITVRFDPSDKDTPWHAQLDGWCLWCQAKTPGEAADGVLVAMREVPEVYGDQLAEIGDREAAELALVEEAERQMAPHAEDAHADSAPHG